MIERVHEHLTSELKQSARTDTVFVLAAIVLNLVILAVNSGIAGEDPDTTETVLMFIFIILQVFVNIAVVFGLQKGKKLRVTILDGLIRMYKDQGVDMYYSKQMLEGYSTRYNIFMFIIVAIGAVSVAAALIMRFL
ncbi:MAG: hypothetical protein JW852_12215 [Spirochaetales bacterium]|nr:hypothetical protein [Spirochaetales bacterium]